MHQQQRPMAGVYLRERVLSASFFIVHYAFSFSSFDSEFIRASVLSCSAPAEFNAAINDSVP